MLRCVSWWIIVSLAPGALHAQAAALEDSADVHYYDQWPGEWFRSGPGIADALPTFVVRKGPGNSFVEDWRLVIDGNPSYSVAIRAWDPETRQWRLLWASDAGLFQLWDGVKIGGGWYTKR